jgi:hypothetical protein
MWFERALFLKSGVAVSNGYAYQPIKVDACAIYRIVHFRLPGACL